MEMKRRFLAKGYRLWLDSPTNQQFVVVTDDEARYLAASYVYEPELRLSDGRQVIRFCTSWSTRDSDVDALVEDIARMKERCPRA